LPRRRDRREGDGQRQAVHVDAGRVHGAGASRVVESVGLLLAVVSHRLRRIRGRATLEPARRRVRGSDPEPADHRRHAEDRHPEAAASARGDAAVDRRLLGLRRVRLERGHEDVHPVARSGSAPGAARHGQGARPLESVRGQRADQHHLPGTGAPQGDPCMKTLIEGGWVVAHNGQSHEVHESGSVVIENDTIVHAGGPYTGSADQTISARGKLVSPGFINTHVHTAGGGGDYLLLDMAKNDYRTANYMSFAAPLKGKMTPPPADAVAALRTFTFLHALKNGTTTVIDVGGLRGD